MRKNGSPIKQKAKGEYGLQTKSIIPHVLDITQFEWQGQTVAFGKVPLRYLQTPTVNPKWRTNRDEKKLKNLDMDLFGNEEKRILPKHRLLSFPIIDNYGNIIDGNGRVEIIHSHGIDYVPCIIHFKIDPIDSFFTMSDKDHMKPLNYNDLISSLSRGLPLEKLPKRLQRDYKNLTQILDENFIKRNLIVERKGVPSFFTVNKMLSEFSSAKWFNSKDKELMHKCYWWLFVLKNQEAMRAIGGFKSSFTPTARDKKLIMDSVLSGGKLVPSEDGWINLDSSSEEVRKRIAANQDLCQI